MEYFKTIKEISIDFGEDCFIEIADKVLKTDVGDKNIVTLTSGYYTREGIKKFTKDIDLPSTDEIMQKVVGELLVISYAWSIREKK